MEADLGKLSLAEPGSDEVLEDELDGRPMHWREALSAIDEAADAMTLGDLLHGECFSMHDAMSALQMMDPQMDSGMATADQPPPPPPPDSIELPELVAIVDELLRGEVAWYSGLPLVQTVFRLDWLHITRQPCHARLGAVMLGAVRGAAAVRVLVLRSGVCDEEDFSSSSYGLDMRDDVPDADVLRQLIGEEEEAAGELRDAKAEGPTAEERAALLEAVLCRLRLRRSLFAVLGNLLRPGVKALETCRRMVALCEAQLAGVRASIPLGAPVESLACMAGKASSALLGSAPLRKVELPTREEAIDRLEALLAQVKEGGGGESRVYGGQRRCGRLSYRPGRKRWIGWKSCWRR
jgi:hypothetical protein